MSSNNRLRRVQKVAEQSSWRACLKRKRLMELGSSSSQSSAAASQLPFQLESLPLNCLTIVASQLPFTDFKNIGLVNKKLNKVQRDTRYSRKRISVDLLRKLFPDEMPSSTSDDSDDSLCRDSSVGMLQIMRPFRSTLRSSPPRNIQEVDLSEFGAFRESHFVELLRSINNGRELFAEVRRLNVQGCVVEIKDMAFLAKLMPKVWFIRCSTHTLVLPEGNEQRTLSTEQVQELRHRVENFVQVSRQCSKKHLWFLAKLTQVFPCLEVVQMDN